MGNFRWTWPRLTNTIIFGPNQLFVLILVILNPFQNKWVEAVHVFQIIMSQYSSLYTEMSEEINQVLCLSIEAERFSGLVGFSRFNLCCAAIHLKKCNLSSSYSRLYAQL